MAAAVTHQQHGMVGQFEGIEGVCEACVVVDALRVVHKVRVDLKEDGDNLIFHCVSNSGYTYEAGRSMK